MDHLAHHLLALWALGASPDEMQDQWEYNTLYQAPIEKSSAAASRHLDLRNPVLFDKCLGHDDAYFDFLRFFESEIAKKGMQDVIREYLLKGDNRADDIFCRMYTGEQYLMVVLQNSSPKKPRHRSRTPNHPPRLCPRIQATQSCRRNPRRSLRARQLAQRLPPTHRRIRPINPRHPLRIAPFHAHQPPKRFGNHLRGQGHRSLQQSPRRSSPACRC